jgi:hypothetical protein
VATVLEIRLAHRGGMIVEQAAKRAQCHRPQYRVSPRVPILTVARSIAARQPLLRLLGVRVLKGVARSPCRYGLCSGPRQNLCVVDRISVEHREVSRFAGLDRSPLDTNCGRGIAQVSTRRRLTY